MSFIHQVQFNLLIFSQELVNKFILVANSLANLSTFQYQIVTLIQIEIKFTKKSQFAQVRFLRRVYFHTQNSDIS